MVITLIVPFLMGLAACEAVSPQCQAPSIKHTPQHTMQFTPTMPAQEEPTSTVYGAIKTIHLNVVNCDYAMVENIDSNPTQTGHFTTKTFVPVMTVYRVGCMPETTEVTRREYRGYDPLQPALLPTATPYVAQEEAKQHAKRTSYNALAMDTVLSISDHLASQMDPTNENITVGDYRTLREINTAEFALNLVNSGIPLAELCTYLQNATIAMHLDENMINYNEAANIVCYAARYGLYFGTSNEQLMADLAALAYAVERHAYDNQTVQEICKRLDYGAASMLGVEVDNIRQNICNGTAGVTHSTPLPASVTTALMSTGDSQVTATSFLPFAPSSYGTDFGTGSSIIVGTNGPVFSSATSAAGTVAPWFNTTVTATADVLTVTQSGRDGAQQTTAAAAMPFYNPPRVRRAELRRHGRGMY